MTDIIGAAGVGLILVAYFCSLFTIIPKEGKLFFLLNIAGSGLACAASWLIHYWPFVVLEGIWCIVSWAGLFRSSQKDKASTTA
ncbi:MAG: hypothetical protein U0U70_02505 [Chitinophagaceae bacterium]